MATTRKAWIAIAKNLLEVFLAGQRPSTRKAYEVDLKAFWNHTNAETLAEAIADLIRGDSGNALTQATFYQGALRNNYAPTTVNRRMAALRSITRLARDLGKITWRLRIADLKTTPNRKTAGPGVAAIERMMQAAHLEGGAQGPRDLAIIWLLYGLGLRRAEVANIDREHVHLGEEVPWIDILAKGGNEYEPMTIMGQVKAAIAGWNTYRGDHPGPLFTTMSPAVADKDRRITTKGISDIVKRLGLAVGVRTTPHGLRHTAITEAVRKNNVLDAQIFSRHTDLRTLQTYYDRDKGTAADVAASIAEGM